MISRRTGSFILAALAVAAGTACSPDRAVSLDPLGDPAYGVQLQLAPTNMPRGTTRIPDPHPTDVPNTTQLGDTIQVTLAGVDSLTNAVYSVWLADSLGQNVVKAVGTLRVIVTDTVLDAFGDPVAAPDTTFYPNVSAFSNGGPRHSVQLTTSRAESGMAADDLVQTVFVTIEADAGASTPAPTRRPLWGNRAGGTSVRTIVDIDTIGFEFDTVDTSPLEIDTLPITDTTFIPRHRISNLNFGNFAFAPEVPYVYIPTGRGQAFVRGDILLINDSSLTRPPLGYFYAGYAVIRDETNAPIDTVYLGPLHSPPPSRDISLRDADSVLIDPDVQVLVNPPNLAGTWSNPAPSAILAASIRASADTIPAFLSATGPFAGMAEVFLTIESKHAEAGRMGPAILLRANVPDIVRFGDQ